jgi:mono/diheme cytochrome c family protein
MKIASNLFFSVAAVAVMSAAAFGQEQVTFTKDVAPIFEEHCQVCHRAGTVAPMSLLTYQEARPWAKAIKQKVLAREMPPWFLDKNVGVQHFDNDISLTDEEIATIARWVDGGALQGNPADLPSPRQFPDEQAWQAGKPDLVITLPKDLIVKAHGPDWWPNVLVDPGLTEDRYVQAIQIIPTKGYRDIHHIRTSLVAPADGSVHSAQLDGNVELTMGEQGVFLDEYAIGKGADIFKEGAGRLIKAGTEINFQFHLHPGGDGGSGQRPLGLEVLPQGLHAPTLDHFRHGRGEHNRPPAA